jgi:predicted transcriptional regulator
MQLEVPVKKKSLENARTELLLTQKELADLAKVSVSVVIGCENGRLIRRLSAQALLKALNRKRKEEELEPLDFDELDWKIQGE